MRGGGPSYQLTVAYDGTDYFGWQVQGERPTIQLVLERAVAALTGQQLRLRASGRTDTGVHALGQVVSFDADLPLDDSTLCRALNAHLPPDIRVLEAVRHERGFHALRDVVGKRYRYVIQDGPRTDLFRRRHAWRIYPTLDEAAMADAAARLVGRHDFKCFEAAGSERVGTVRTIRDLQVRREAPPPAGVVSIEVEADGFLYNMVRIIVGTLADVGRGKRPPEWVEEVLRSRDRTLAGMTAPPQGLFLLWVQCAERPGAEDAAHGDDVAAGQGRGGGAD